jgi:hypothetical protein
LNSGVGNVHAENAENAEIRLDDSVIVQPAPPSPTNHFDHVDRAPVLLGVLGVLGVNR